MSITPYDARILWWHWQGGVVEEKTIADLARSVRVGTPNAAGIAIKSSNGHQWQGEFRDSNPAMAVTGPESISTWAQELIAQQMELHLWCVVHGTDPAAEAERIISACHVPGVRSMILDVEAGEQYFGSHPASIARNLIRRINRDLPSGFHLGLCLFTRNDEPRRIHVEEWLPYVGSLHPMVYHWDFSGGQGEPEPYLNEAFATLAPYELPVVPLLGTYADPSTGADVPPHHIERAGNHAFALGAAGISLFRLGAVGPGIFQAVSRISPL